MKKEYVKITKENELVQPVVVYSKVEIENLQMSDNEKMVKLIELSLIDIDSYLEVIKHITRS